LNDLVNWPGISLGSADPWAPANLLVIPGFATNDMSQAQTYRNWPLGSYVTFGVPWNPVDFPGDRCGITTPAQTALLLPIVQGAAAETTLFTDASGVSMGLGLRPILPGETMAGICP
jgi:hypothetical protein